MVFMVVVSGPWVQPYYRPTYPCTSSLRDRLEPRTLACSLLHPSSTYSISGAVLRVGVTLRSEMYAFLILIREDLDRLMKFGGVLCVV